MVAALEVEVVCGLGADHARLAENSDRRRQSIPHHDASLYWSPFAVASSLLASYRAQAEVASYIAHTERALGVNVGLERRAVLLD